MTKFPERLKEARKNKGLKQREVASYLGIRDRSYQNYEGGDREPEYKTLIALADLFDVTTDYLLGRTDIPR